VVRGESRRGRGQKPPHRRHRVRVAVHGKDVEASCEEIRQIPSAATSSVEDAAARIEPATQQLIEQVDIDVAEERVQGRRDREVFAHARTPPL
jgi:plasmid stability protein